MSSGERHKMTVDQIREDNIRRIANIETTSSQKETKRRSKMKDLSFRSEITLLITSLFTAAAIIIWQIVAAQSYMENSDAAHSFIYILLRVVILAVLILSVIIKMKVIGEPSEKACFAMAFILFFGGIWFTLKDIPAVKILGYLIIPAAAITLFCIVSDQRG